MYNTKPAYSMTKSCNFNIFAEENEIGMSKYNSKRYIILC